MDELLFEFGLNTPCKYKTTMTPAAIARRTMTATAQNVRRFLLAADASLSASRRTNILIILFPISRLSHTVSLQEKKLTSGIVAPKEAYCSKKQKESKKL